MSFVVLILAISVFGSHIRIISFGPISMAGVVSLLLPLVAAMLIMRSGKILRASLQAALPLGLLVVLVWVMTLLQWVSPLPRFENTPFILTGIFLIFLCGGLSKAHLDDQQFFMAYWRAALFLLAFLTFVAAVRDQDPATSQLIALFAPIFFLMAVFRRSPFAILALVLMLAQTFLLESRIVLLALVVQFLITLLLLMQRRPVTALLGGGLILSAAMVAPLIFDFSQFVGGGDNALNVGGVNINTAGRIYYWAVVIESWMQNPIFGTGYSIAPEMFLVGRWSQPHNDYLRLLHLAGGVGLALWIGFLVLTLRKLLRLAHHRTGLTLGYGQFIVLMAFLATLGIAIMMVTDNTIVYSYIVYPWAMLVGRAVVTVVPTQAHRSVG